MVSQVDSSLNAPASPIPDDWAGEPLLVIFFIPAPVSLALPHASTWRFARDEDVDWLRDVLWSPIPEISSQEPVPSENGKNFVSVRLWREKEELSVDLKPLERAWHVYSEVTGDWPLESGESPQYSMDNDSYATVFEAVTPLLPSVDANGNIGVDESVSHALDRSLDSLAHLYRAYRVRSDDYRVRTLNRDNIYPFIPWTTRDPFSDELEFGGMSYVLANLGAHIIPRPVGDLIERDGYVGALQRIVNDDPLLVYSEHMRSSQRALFLDSDYSTSVVWTHTASEVLFNTILLMMAWEEAAPEDEVSKWFRSRACSP